MNKHKIFGLALCLATSLVAMERESDTEAPAAAACAMSREDQEAMFVQRIAGFTRMNPRSREEFLKHIAEDASPDECIGIAQAMTCNSMHYLSLKEGVPGS